MVPDTKYWKLGILGWPLGYSLSPLIHERALKAAGLQGEYREYPVASDQIWDWLSHVGSLGLDGFNVTMPYKQSVFAWVVAEGQLGQPDHLNLAIEAVNTVVMKEKRPVGYNTDGKGFLRPLTDPPRGLDLTGWRVVLLGAGGAAQAIACTLALETKVEHLTIWNRHPERAQRLAWHIGELPRVRQRHFVDAVKEVESLPIREANLIVNTTSVGMTPPPASPAEGGSNLRLDRPDGPKSGGGVKENPGNLIDPKALGPEQVVYDIVYEPRETPLIQAARKRGCPVITGEEMLAGQAAEAFELWTGIPGMLPIMQQALNEPRTDSL